MNDDSSGNKDWSGNKVDWKCRACGRAEPAAYCAGPQPLRCSGCNEYALFIDDVQLAGGLTKSQAALVRAVDRLASWCAASGAAGQRRLVLELDAPRPRDGGWVAYTHVGELPDSLVNQSGGDDNCPLPFGEAVSSLAGAVYDDAARLVVKEEQQPNADPSGLCDRCPANHVAPKSGAWLFCELPAGHEGLHLRDGFTRADKDCGSASAERYWKEQALAAHTNAKAAK